MDRPGKPRGSPPGRGGGGNVILLKFRSPHVEDDQRAFLSCRNCKNKTYRMVLDQPSGFPMMECAACGAHIGRMGWAHDDDPVLNEGT